MYNKLGAFVNALILIGGISEKAIVLPDTNAAVSGTLPHIDRHDRSSIGEGGGSKKRAYFRCPSDGRKGRP